LQPSAFGESKSRVVDCYRRRVLSGAAIGENVIVVRLPISGSNESLDVAISPDPLADVRPVLYAASLLTPIFMSGAAIALTWRARVLWKVLLVNLAAVSSLPVGFLLVLLALERWDLPWHREQNPGVGVAAIPLLPIWLLTVLLCVGASLWIISQRRKSV
jgi:hypothetical protein